MEAAYLSLFEDVGKGLCLLQGDLKVGFGGFPAMCCCGGETRDRLREARDSRERYRSGADQLTSER